MDGRARLPPSRSATARREPRPPNVNSRTVSGRTCRGYGERRNSALTVTAPIRNDEETRELVEDNTIIRLSAKDLDFFYDSYQALHKISLNVPACQVTALIGPS